MSSTGTAKSLRQSCAASHRRAPPKADAGRRPTTWSDRSIASSKGRRWASVQGSEAVEMSVRGCVAPSSPRARARSQPRCSAETTSASAALPSFFRAATSASAIASGAVADGSDGAKTTTRTAAPGSGSRRAWAANGSSDSAESSDEGASAMGLGMVARGSGLARRAARASAQG